MSKPEDAVFGVVKKAGEMGGLLEGGEKIDMFKDDREKELGFYPPSDKLAEKEMQLRDENTTAWNKGFGEYLKTVIGNVPEQYVNDMRMLWEMIGEEYHVKEIKSGHNIGTTNTDQLTRR